VEADDFTRTLRACRSLGPARIFTSNLYKQVQRLKLDRDHDCAIAWSGGAVLRPEKSGRAA